MLSHEMEIGAEYALAQGAVHRKGYRVKIALAHHTRQASGTEHLAVHRYAGARRVQ